MDGRVCLCDGIRGAATCLWCEYTETGKAIQKLMNAIDPGVQIMRDVGRACKADIDRMLAESGARLVYDPNGPLGIGVVMDSDQDAADPLHDGPVVGRWYWVTCDMESWFPAQLDSYGRWANSDTWEDFDHDVVAWKLIPLPSELP